MSTKLSVAFPLCQISSAEEIRGVTNYPEHVLVTLNRNMVSKFKVSQQRPINSWTNKDSFYKNAVFDSESEKYAALINKNTLKLWGENDNLSKLKKYIFTAPIWKLIDGPKNETYIVFENGCVKKLNHAIDTRKETQENFVINEDEVIIDCVVVLVNDITYNVLISVNNEQEYIITVHTLKDNDMEFETKFELNLIPKYELLGLNIQSFDNKLNLLSFWSNETLYSLSLLNWEGNNWGNELGQISMLSSNQLVNIKSLSNKHIAVFGAHNQGEGAILLIYNTQFHVIQAQKIFKLYSSPPLMWGPFNKELLIVIGNQLMVSKFQLVHESLASMIGSDTNTKECVEQVQWIPGNKGITSTGFKTVPKSINKLVKGYNEQGFSEARIASLLIDDLIEKKDMNALVWCLDNLREISENFIVKSLSFALKLSEKEISSLNLHTEQQQTDELINSPFQDGRKVLINKILDVPFNTLRLLPELKKYLVSNEGILLLEHVAASIWLGEEPAKVDNLNQLVQWCNALLDSNYQYILLSGDSKVLKILTALSDIVETQLHQIEDLRNIEQILLEMRAGKQIHEHSNDSLYTIETIVLE